MSKYLELAEELEKLAEKNDSSLGLEKIASLCLLYEYFKNDGDLLKNEVLTKTAQRVFAEQNLALEIGIKSMTQAFHK